MRNINRVTIAGNLTREPELRHTKDGLAIMGICVAVNDSRKNQSTGEWEDYPNYVDCTLIGERAEKLAPKLAKGQKVCIDGKLRFVSWEKDGQKRSKLEVAIDHIEFFGKKEQERELVQETVGVYDADVPF